MARLRAAGDPGETRLSDTCDTMTVSLPASPVIDLTPEQREVVEWAGGPLMVLAGAGTGKTTVIVERVRHLLATRPDLAPENLLVLTYNVRAALELGDRLARRLGAERAGRLTVENFHSFGYRTLRDHAAEIGLPEDIEILDAVGQRLLLLAIRPRLDLRYFVWGEDPSRLIGDFVAIVNRAKDELVTPAAYRAFADGRLAAFEAGHGPGTYAAALASLFERGLVRDAREVRKALGGPDLEKEARKAARRSVRGDGSLGSEATLSHEQREAVAALAPTLVRDAEALEVLRLQEEALVYAAYQDELARRGALDFGEQIQLAIRLLETRPNILRELQRRYRHVLVDEFQDANIAQIRLVELVGRAPDRPDDVVVVGDDDQSIYRFRGASFAAFRQFEDRFSRPPEFAPDRPALPVAIRPLLLNRRSTGRVLSAASRLIAVNPQRLKAGEGPLRPSRPAGDRIELLISRSEEEEAEALVERVRDLFAALPDPVTGPDGRARPRRWGDVAVLYRKHQHRELIVDRLRRAGIPHTVVGGAGLFLQPEIRDVEAALRVLVDPEDSVSFTRVLSAAPWRLDAVEILRVTRAAAFDRRPVFVAAAEIVRSGTLRVDGPPPAAPEAESAGVTSPDPGAAPVSARAATGIVGEAAAPVPPPPARTHREAADAALRVKLERLLGALGDLSARSHRDGPFTILDEYLVRTGVLTDLLALDLPEAQRTALGIARLMRFVADWQRDRPAASLADFVAYLDVYQQMGGDLDLEPGDRGEVDGVQLMTVYQAKGLEYEVVLVPRLVQGQFPDERISAVPIPVDLLRQAPPDEYAVAEERRLLFVAMTRARQHLVLSAIDGDRSRPSRFAAEVAPEGGVSAEGPAPRGPRQPIAPEAGIARWGGGPDDVTVTVLAPASDEAPPLQDEPGAPVPADALAAATVATQARLLRLMPVPVAFERRFALRRRAVELIGALEALAPDDTEGRDAIVTELVAVAGDAAGAAEEQRRNGVDPITLRVLSRHAAAGRSLLELAPLPVAFSHSQLQSYATCPLRYAFEKVYRIPVAVERGYFTFGSAIHDAFEKFIVAKREAAAAGLPEPGRAELHAAFDRAWEAVRPGLGDAGRAAWYEGRSGPALDRFYERELRSTSLAIAVEAGFALEIDPGDGGAPIGFNGRLDRIDRHADGSIEVVDYKTGKPRSQREVDTDDQLSAYAFALREGGVVDPTTGDPLPAPARVTLYFTEEDLALSTTRTDAQLDEYRARLVATALRIRSGDFAATPGWDACGRCDYVRICPNRFREGDL